MFFKTIVTCFAFLQWTVYQMSSALDCQLMAAISSGLLWRSRFLCKSNPFLSTTKKKGLMEPFMPLNLLYSGLVSPSRRTREASVMVLLTSPSNPISSFKCLLFLALASLMPTTKAAAASLSDARLAWGGKSPSARQNIGWLPVLNNHWNCCSWYSVIFHRKANFKYHYCEYAPSYLVF